MYGLCDVGSGQISRHVVTHRQRSARAKYILYISSRYVNHLQPKSAFIHSGNLPLIIARFRNAGSSWMFLKTVLILSFLRVRLSFSASGCVTESGCV